MVLTDQAVLRGGCCRLPTGCCMMGLCRCRQNTSLVPGAVGWAVLMLYCVNADVFRIVSTNFSCLSPCFFQHHPSVARDT